MTPVRSILLSESSLLASVCDGLQALEKPHRDYVDNDIRSSFADSLDLDKAIQKGHEGENRWDYLLGHAQSNKVIGLEPHSAKSDQISTVIAKRRAALDQIKGHLKSGTKFAAWFWVASGRVEFLPLDKALLRLSQNGITFVGGRFQKKHLDKLLPVDLSPRDSQEDSAKSKKRSASKGKKTSR